MKKAILLLLAVCAVFSQTFAQNCEKFVYMTNGKVVKYSSTNNKGKLTTKMIYSVTAKTGNKATVQSQVFDAKDKPVTTASVEMICAGNSLKLDMRGFVPNMGASMKGMTAKGDVSYLTYPAKMSKGQVLPEGIFNLEMYKDEQKMSTINYKIVNRTVQDMESITTPAGTYDCYKIVYDAEMKSTTFGISIPFNMKMVEWYSDKLGLFVKSEASDKKGKLMSVTTLDSIN
ncbi:MAG: hypothetical protein EOP47_24120 [Sphingobacteriaceae bacterium]|nr:MAG: hypothetical protein EOP47_24120 [Sphingobacteriaceae bacterium]